MASHTDCNEQNFKSCLVDKGLLYTSLILLDELSRQLYNVTYEHLSHDLKYRLIRNIANEADAIGYNPYRPIYIALGTSLSIIHYALMNAPMANDKIEIYSQAADFIYQYAGRQTGQKCKRCPFL